MVERPAASIVIPLLNQRDDWLRHCVLSALRQTVPTDVVVVCSPGTCAANSATLRALAEQSHRLRTCVQEGGGFAAAINQGLRRAECKRIGLLLSDDWLKQDAVEKCLAGDLVHCAGVRIQVLDAVDGMLGERSAQIGNAEMSAKAAHVSLGGRDDEYDIRSSRIHH